MEDNRRSLTVFVDESGSITKTNIRRNKYFVIALLFTRDTLKLKRAFRKEIAILVRNERYKSLLKLNGEIKGKDLSETVKKPIYERMVRKCADEFEIGIIVLSNDYTTDKFIENHARAFNFLIQKYMDSSFRNFSKYSKGNSGIHFVIDNQNISTDAAYTLEGYLNQHLTIENALCDYFRVNYVDSKNNTLVQFIDFISNSFYRNLTRHDRTGVENIKLLMNCVCRNRLFDGSANHDTKLFLG
jgi:hypothetical protein